MAVARTLRGVPIVERVMSKYRPQATRGDPTTEAVSPQVPIDELGNYMSGSVGKPSLSPLGDITGAQNDCKPRVLTDLPVSSMGTAILANEAIVITAHPNEGLSLWA